MSPSQKKRLLRVCVTGGMVMIALVGYILFFQATGRGIPCLLYQLTGLQCAGCGLTRAAASLLRADVAAAFGYNPLWPVFAVYLGWILASDAWVYIRRGELPFLPGRWWAHVPVAAVIVGYGILRNFL